MPKKIILGVTASIACYKALELIRELDKKSVAVQVITTPKTSHFVSPLTFEALSHNKVHSELWDRDIWDLGHLRLAEETDLIIVYPASANFIARLAAGMAEELLETVILSSKPQKVILAPAMDEDMWKNPATQNNVSALKRMGYTFLGPAKGALASGRVGLGRLIEPAEAVSVILKSL